MRLWGQAPREGVQILDGGRESLKELQIKPNDPRSHCEACKAGVLHSQAVCPQKGDKRGRESVPVKRATKNRIPGLLAVVIGRAMIIGRERSKVRALEASRKRKC